MRVPFQKRLKAFIGVFLLLVLPLADTVAGAVNNGVGVNTCMQAVVLEQGDEAPDLLSFSALRFEFANWIPEAIRSVNIRMTNLAPSVGGLAIFISFKLVRVVFPLHQPDDFSIKPDFVGFLFRLKPF
ncbi:hypothetical protein [Flavihumibacter sp. CACIAM 22H1]|uniref:hypothetical protein n=1 Tax=Flavihumibacter sp. CACIAM 22H1 TaxID=1812911 RepID=UPI0007A92B4A|nr:hypothetical protein [Flavihumibacter sp. CACIAM 22H1]KYP13282.1 MAG: hypothetical protein A1D16_12125 [Flavihumibacter sp. CACIAM 22H1]